MLINNLNHIVTFCKNSRTVFSGGVYSNTVITISNEWASVQRVNMSNDRNNLKDQQMIFYNVTVRNALIGTNKETINNKMFINWSGKTLNINCTNDGAGRGIYLKINCQEETI